MTLNEALQYYVDQLIIQYKTLNKASNTIKCLVNNSYCDGLVLQLQTAFDLGIAVGDQLTIIGKIVGVPRNIYGLDLGHTFFSFTRYTGTPASVGFGRYASQPDADLWFRYLSHANYVLTDFEMLSLIQLKIIYNNTFEALGPIKNAIYGIFAGGIDVIDNKNYSLTYNFTMSYYNVGAVCGYLGNILPKPMGVKVTIVNI